jgi:hypothetical protein
MKTSKKFLLCLMPLYFLINTHAYAAKNCQSLVTMDGKQHTNKSTARGNARDAWKDKVLSSYDKKFAHWYKAKDNDVSCGEPIGKYPNREWICTAKAKPCE